MVCSRRVARPSQYLHASAPTCSAQVPPPWPALQPLPSLSATRAAPDSLARSTLLDPPAPCVPVAASARVSMAPAAWMRGPKECRGSGLRARAPALRTRGSQQPHSTQPPCPPRTVPGLCRIRARWARAPHLQHLTTTVSHALPPCLQALLRVAMGARTAPSPSSPTRPRLCRAWEPRHPRCGRATMHSQALAGARGDEHTAHSPACLCLALACCPWRPAPCCPVSWG